MSKLLVFVFLSFLFISNSFSDQKLFCSEDKYYMDYNSLNNLEEIEINIINKKKWYRNIFSIIRNTGWIQNDLKKNHRVTIFFKFKGGLICKDFAKIRFHGDNKDHYKLVDDFNIISSLNVSLSNTNLENITEFKLFLPNSRKDENEIFATNLLRNLKFLSPKTKKINVKLGAIKNEYLFQEKITKELIENNGFPEGPIIEGDQRFLSKGLRSLQLARIVNKNWSSRNWRNIYISLHALSKINETYIDFYKSINEFKVSKAYAINYSDAVLNQNNLFNNKNFYLSFYDKLLSTMNSYNHALVPDNRSFYFNYFENYFYPIYYDGDINIKKNYLNHKEFDKLDNNKFIINEINKIDKKNLDSLNRLSGVKTLNIDKINLYFKYLIYNLKNISEEQIEEKEAKNLLDQSNFYSRFKLKNVKLIFFNNYPNNFLICESNISECKQKKFNLEEIGQILSQRYKPDSKYTYIFVSSNFKKYSEGDHIILNESKWTNIEIENLFVKYTKHEINLDVDYLNKIININQLRADGRVFIYSNSKIKDWTINFKSNNENIDKILGFNYPESLDGCITIYNSDIENIEVRVIDGICEDSLNLVRSEGNINKIIISNSYKDGLDMDFSNIKINQLEVNSSGNDCVDLSFGKYNISNLKLINCKDNAVSVGEKSILNSENLYVTNSLNALAVKDSSKVSLKYLSSKNNKFCFKLYNKKQEFLGGELKLNKLKCDSDYRIDKNSNYHYNEL